MLNYEQFLTEVMLGSSISVLLSLNIRQKYDSIKYLFLFFD